MKHLAIAAVILWAAFHFGGMFFSSEDRATETAFSKLIEAPQRSIENPYRNGYFYLFGLTAAEAQKAVVAALRAVASETPAVFAACLVLAPFTTSRPASSRRSRASR